MSIPLSPSGKKRPKPEIVSEKQKDKEDEMCDCACHDNPNMIHIMACCKRCGEQRAKKS